ncbi:hypothetical protein C1X27_04815 [Pseudomonas sp. MPR-AND1B]|nr:hypothetical protein C1X26_14580 [Pseudomonas sp. MPR-R3A]PMY97721.1 hypothetical protein C1X24_13465 [Pseudomonas sp. FW305-124]PMZ68516.1 hypothetical protein C1X25_22720 [Pseudomonas sp. GW247-3R2A]PNA96780.1 hypothetical protein C1X23_00785 [Pseudomonas sp. FW300-E2]PNB04043.1 hypothetical protein C1X27_04815 [Pseudomonas sp. MPR-AND1B]PRW69483.1 hypothetical protein C7A09_07745 [Pseudomonas fluorescens]
MARELAPVTTGQPAHIHLTPRDQTVGAGCSRRRPDSQHSWIVYIHCCGNGHLGFRLTAGHFGKEPECRPSPK